MSADRPTAHRPRGEIDAFEWQMDSRVRSSAQTKSKPVTDSALSRGGSWLSASQKEARSVQVWLVHRCCNPIHGRKFASVANLPSMKLTQLNRRWTRTFDHRLKLNQSRSQRAHWLSPESSPDSVGLDCRSGAGAPGAGDSHLLLGRADVFVMRLLRAFRIAMARALGPPPVPRSGSWRGRSSLICLAATARSRCVGDWYCQGPIPLFLCSRHPPSQSKVGLQVDDRRIPLVSPV